VTSIHPLTLSLCVGIRNKITINNKTSKIYAQAKYKYAPLNNSDIQWKKKRIVCIWKDVDTSCPQSVSHKLAYTNKKQWKTSSWQRQFYVCAFLKRRHRECIKYCRYFDKNIALHILTKYIHIHILHFR